MITFMVDEFTPCLKDCETGEIFHTEVVELKRKKLSGPVSFQERMVCQLEQIPEERQGFRACTERNHGHSGTDRRFAQR